MPCSGIDAVNKRCNIDKVLRYLCSAVALMTVRCGIFPNIQIDY